jgi:alkanesulfonate monooxygenase SsuD/methylene tetrahydromethanopterin reductase-like flavin-dependent oxidoreductase (luciferase family)
MKVGLAVPTWSGAGGGRDLSWDELVSGAQAAEDAGLDSLWVGDTLLVFDLDAGLHECWTTIAALAAATTRIGLGSLVSAIGFRNPALLAKTVHTVNFLSGGRLTLGLGAGGHERQHRAFGFPHEDRFERLEEALPLVRRLLDGEVVTHRGTYYELRNCELLPRRSGELRPQILLAGVSTRLLDLAAQHADAWNAWLAYSDSSAGALIPHLRRLDEACKRVGRNPQDLMVSAGVAVCMEGGRVGFDQLDLSTGAIHGDAGRIEDELRAFAAIGVDLLQVQLEPFTVENIITFGSIARRLRNE